VTTHPAPEPTGPRHHRVAVRGWVRWAIGIAVLVAIAWAIVALAPRQPRPRLVSDPEAAPADSCGAFGAEPSDPADGSVGFVPCTLPAGFVLIEPPVDVASSASTDGTVQPYVVYYSRMIGDDAPDSIAVITVASDVPEPGGDTVVRGHPARLVEPSADGLPLQLRWTERPGLNVQISAWGAVSVAEVLEVAEGLTPWPSVDTTTTTVPGATDLATSTTGIDTTPATNGGSTPGPSTSSTGATGSPSSTTTTTSTTPAPTGTGPSSTTSTTTATTGGGSTPTTLAITIPPAIESIVPTLPSVTTTDPDGGLGDLPVIGDLPIVGDLLDPPDGSDDGDGDDPGISDVPVIGGLPLLGTASTSTTSATPADEGSTSATTSAG
jgi:hypothetical protein